MAPARHPLLRYRERSGLKIKCPEVPVGSASSIFSLIFGGAQIGPTQIDTPGFTQSMGPSWCSLTPAVTLRPVAPTGPELADTAGPQVKSEHVHHSPNPLFAGSFGLSRHG